MMRMVKKIGKALKKFVRDPKGSISDVVKLAIAAIVAAALIPTAVTQVSTVNTTGWDQTAATLWPLVPVFLVLGIALVFFKIVEKKI
jgi:hypothetical protein